MNQTRYKPINRKNYGHIPHFPGSRIGPGDHKCHEGQLRIATEKARDKHDIISVTEKLDGSNVGVARQNDILYPLGRAGYLANSSPHKQHQLFSNWVYENQDRFMAILNNGERLCGEWLLQAHGTRYDLPHEPFVAFDLMTGSKRTPYSEFTERVLDYFIIPHIIHSGAPLSIKEAMEMLGPYGFHGALEQVEGAVWRVERKGEFDFMAKYVRPDKKDGLYLERNTGEKPTWNTFWESTQGRGNNGKQKA